MLTSEITWKLEADNASLALLFVVWRKHDMLQSLLDIKGLSPCDTCIGYCDYVPNSRSQFQYNSLVA